MTLRVRFEIVPSGDEGRTFEIAHLDISNYGDVEMPHATFGTYCQYKAKLVQRDQNMQPASITYDQSVVHCREDGPYVLTARVIEQLIRPK